MFKVNNTVDWLRAKSQEDRDRIMDVIRKWRYRKSKEAKEQKRELEMEAETLKRGEEKIKRNKIREQQNQEKQDAMDAQPIWSTPQLAWDAVAQIPASAKTERYMAIKQQWQYAKKWASILKINWPKEFSKQPSGSEPEHWWVQFGKVITHETGILKQLAAGKEKMAKENELRARNQVGATHIVNVDVVSLPLAQHTRPTKESINAIINKASKFDGHNVLHRKQDAEEVRRRQAAGEDIAEMMLPDDFAGEGDGESEEEED